MTGFQPARYYYFALESKSRVSSSSTTSALVLWVGFEPTCDQLPFLQGISLRGYQSECRVLRCCADTHSTSVNFIHPKLTKLTLFIKTTDFSQLIFRSQLRGYYPSQVPSFTRWAIRHKYYLYLINSIL